MSTRESVHEYVRALQTADFAAVRFTEDAEFVSPLLDQPMRGGEALRDGLQQAAAGMGEVELVELIVEGDRAAARIRFSAEGARVEVCD